MQNLNTIFSNTVIYPLSFAVGTSLLASAGWMGGHLLRWVVPSIVPVHYGIATGLWAPATAGVIALATRINQKGAAVNYTFGIIAGYFGAVSFANLMGYSVSYVGPFLGLTALSFPIAASVAMLAPIALALIAISNVGKTIRDFLLHSE